MWIPKCDICQKVDMSGETNPENTSWATLSFHHNYFDTQDILICTNCQDAMGLKGVPNITRSMAVESWLLSMLRSARYGPEIEDWGEGKENSND